MVYLQKNADMKYKRTITPKMRSVSEILFNNFVGMDNCITDDHRNLIVEVPKNMCDAVRTELKKKFRDVTLMRNAYLMIDDLHDFILVKPMITESPVYEENGVIVPELEKLLVDKDSDREYASLDDTFIQKEFQRAFELYPVNTSRLLRYAGRKGKKEEILSRINRINQERVAIVRNIQNYFQQEPVERAWLFGSFSRMEESPDSDIDIIVSFDKEAKVSLFDHLGMKNDLQDLLGRDVDLVTEGTFLPYIANTADNDKVLIYERVS